MAAAGLNMTSFDPWLKDYYIQRKTLDNLLYGPDPLLRDLKKLPSSMQVAGGRIVVPLKIGMNTNSSRSFSVAQEKAKQYTGARIRFNVEVDKDFAVGRVENLTAYASRKDIGAFISAFKDEMDSSIQSLAKRRSQDIVGAGDSVRGTVAASGVNGARTQITLADASDDINFEINDTLVFAASTDRAGASLRQTGSSASDNVVRVKQVIGRGTSTVILELTAALNASHTIADGDVIFKEGDNGQVNSLKGLAAWLPVTAPTSGDSFFGVDRSQETTRLSGFRKTITSNVDLAAEVREMSARIYKLTGKSPDSFWLNPITFNKMVNSSTNNIRYNVDGMVAQNATLGFQGIKIPTAGGVVEVKTGPNIPESRGYLLNMDTWAIYYVADEGGRFVDFIKNKNGSYWRESHDDASIEVRVESYGALACNAPGCNGVISGLQNLT